MEPEIMLFDEPTSALDLYHQQHLLRMLKTLTSSGELHVCIVLHDLNLAALWADGKCWCVEFPYVGTSFISACSRYFSLWYCHYETPPKLNLFL